LSGRAVGIVAKDNGIMGKITQKLWKVLHTPNRWNIGWDDGCYDALDGL